MLVDQNHKGAIWHACYNNLGFEEYQSELSVSLSFQLWVSSQFVEYCAYAPKNIIALDPMSLDAKT